MPQSMNITQSDFKIAPTLTLPEDEVQLWRVDLSALRASESRWQKILSPDEAARAARFRFAVDRQRFGISRALLRTILGGYLQSDPRGLAFSYSQREKPSLAQPHAASGIVFNISHSGEVTLLAFTRRREIGVDVEQVRRHSDMEAVACRFFSAHEQKQLFALPAEERFEAFFRCWTRKEAYIKATGDGLSLPLNQFDVSIAPSNSNALLATRPDVSEAARWLLREVPAGPGYVGALCVHGQDWHLRDWTSPRLCSPQ
jgi:4'-phosphopantetheinyl transferase